MRTHHFQQWLAGRGSRGVFRGLFLSVLLLTVSGGTASARTAAAPERPKRIYDFQWYKKNQWNITVTNYGTFGYGIGRSGGEWPAGSGDMYIYGAGIWIGSLKKTETGRDTFVSNAYNPNSGKSEMTPGCYDNAGGGYSSRAFERVYIAPDFPPNVADFPQSMHDSVLTPLRIPHGTDTTRGYLYYIPRTAVSTGDAWAVFNDADPSNHVAGKTPRPMGIEVYQTVYSWTLPWNKDIVFFKLDVRNRSADTLQDVYLGIVCDADVGNATDDKCGLCLRKYIRNKDGTDSAYADNLGYVWSEDASPSGFVGFDFLQSPYVKNPDGTIDGFDGLDNNGNGLIDEPAEGRQVGMSAFKMFILANDPKDDFAQYLGLAGHDWSPPYEYNPYDSVDPTPEDKRFLQATGPVTLAPNEVTTVTVATIAARSDRTGDPSTWPYYLAVASRAAQQAYDNNWIMPEPPSAPGVTAIPGDGRVMLVWDNLAETAKDRFFPLAPTLQNPYYVEQDFQGYKVYRSRSGQPGDWQLLASFDKKDGIVFEDTTVVESLRTRATDAGLAYSYVDSSSLRLGFPYYYAVTAFDINYLGSDTFQGQPVPAETLTLESGLAGVRVVPRTQPHGYRPPGSQVDQTGGNPAIRLNIQPVAVAPHAVRPDTFQLRFLEQVYDPVGRRPRYGFVVLNSAGETLVPETRFARKIDEATDTTRLAPTLFDSVITEIKRGKDSLVDTTRGWLPVVEIGLRLHMDAIPTQFFDAIIVHGAFPQESVALRDDAANNRSLWAYRGSNYRIVWKTKGASRTAEVFDIENDRFVPYRYLRRITDADSADGWCLQTLTDAADTLVLGQTRFFYVCGCRFQFRSGGGIHMLPEDGDTWYVRTKALSPAPVYATWRIMVTPVSFDAAQDSRIVRVVPNPYLVRNEWERHRDFRKIKFINLPDHCTIRIYNLAGDLVRTLRHDATRYDVGGVPNQYGGDEDWDLLNESRQKPAPGVYVFHVEPDDGETQVGKFVVIH